MTNKEKIGFSDYLLKSYEENQNRNSKITKEMEAIEEKYKCSPKLYLIVAVYTAGKYLLKYIATIYTYMWLYVKSKFNNKKDIHE